MKYHTGELPSKRICQKYAKDFEESVILIGLRQEVTKIAITCQPHRQFAWESDQSEARLCSEQTLQRDKKDRRINSTEFGTSDNPERERNQGQSLRDSKPQDPIDRYRSTSSSFWGAYSWQQDFTNWRETTRRILSRITSKFPTNRGSTGGVSQASINRLTLDPEEDVSAATDTASWPGDNVPLRKESSKLKCMDWSHTRTFRLVNMLSTRNTFRRLSRRVGFWTQGIDDRRS